ncbi:MAG TPA: ABC transporter permease subunit [Nocardia sp.]|uniref:ABC transporter permease n=1 Tax=Nocardia sp. TaxID=1821 RepID=UPI002B4B315F|nr:ABC transporter permease subunit [Nocardia sp.]HLS77363.1 ABC transporter permease subunit [Nocardia sp.]
MGSPPARSPRTAVATRATWSAAAWRVTGVVLVIALWEWLAARVANPAILPAPGLVVRNAIENFGGSPALAYLGLSETSYLGNLQYTAGVVLTAWAAGSMAGLVSGLLAARVQWVRDLTEPVNYVFGVVPVLVAAPFFLIWFGFGSTGQWVLVAFFSYVTVAGAGMVAALAIPPRFEEYAATLGLGKWSRVRRIVLPQALPSCLAALRVALAAAWGLQTVAELMGSEAGMGRAIAVRTGTGDVASVMALILILGIVAVLADLLFTVSTRKVLRWQ